MKYKIYTILFAAVILLLLVAGTSGTSSSGAPIGSTGAPNELTCGKSGCHTGTDGANNLNQGAAVLSITSVQDLARYVPDSVYDIQVELAEAGVDRFGFSLTVLDTANQRAGTLIVSDARRTQIFEGALQFSGREYMTYRMVGTVPYEPGKGIWSFKWKAPSQASGPVTFYAAGISANNDGTDHGDWVYTQTLVARAAPALLSPAALVCMPNPVRDLVTMQVTPALGPSVTVSLYNHEGRLMRRTDDALVSADRKTLALPAGELKPGWYIIQVTSGSFSESQKILILR